MKTNYLSWDNFRSTVFIHGQQRVHRVSESPYIEIIGDGVANRLGMWLEIAAGAPIPPVLEKLTAISTRIFEQEGRFLLEIATAKASIQRQFYHFTTAVAERMTVEKKPAIEAVVLELQCFTDLLEEKPVLGIERQIGLMGEIIFLEHLIAKIGARALDSWLGPFGEPHDFRFGACEFEVKTTVSPNRIHTIHGMEQLVPSNGCLLFLISVLLGPPGGGEGFSLGEKVTQLSGKLAEDSGRLSQFRKALEVYGYRAADSGHYSRRFVMRRPMGLARVDATFPAITRTTIQNALGSLSSRIESFQYDVNIEGLEYEDGTEEFEKAIPS